MHKFLYCLKCDKEQDFEVRQEKESYPVRGEQTEIIAQVTYCKQCGEQIWNEDLDEVNLKEAYCKYRVSHDLLQPEDIKRIRVKYSLSQTAFGRLLGFGDKTITRYENGSIQDLAQNNLIVLVDYPDVFELLLLRNKEQISKQDFERAISKLTKYKLRTKCGADPIPYRTDHVSYRYDSTSKYFGGLLNVG